GDGRAGARDHALPANEPVGRGAAPLAGEARYLLGMDLLTDPSSWAALVMLVLMEVVLGVDNLVFVAVVTNRLPPERRPLARRIGLGLALILRLALLGTLTEIAALRTPVLVLPWTAPVGPEGHAAFDLAFSWRDLILLGGGLFLIAKATREISHALE